MIPGAGRTWRFGYGPRILFGFLAAFMFGMVVLLLSVPFIAGDGDRASIAIVDVTSAIVLGFAVFMTFGLIAAVRLKIAIAGTDLVATVPRQHSWLLVPHFRTVTVPLKQIAAVERRQEVYRWLGVSTMRESLSVVTAGGERIGLFSNTSGAATQLPLDEIAASIAAAAGVTVTDGGTVRTHAPGLYGEASSAWTEPPLDQAAATKARRTAAQTMQILSFLVLMTLLLRACT